MVPKLTPFWRFLDSRPRPIAVIAEWQDRTGDAFDAIKPLLRATGEHARSYPNPNPYGSPLHVVKHRDGSIVAVCPEGESARQLLDASDIVLYELVLDRLARQVARSLNLVGRSRPITRDVLHIGEWSVQTGCACAVCLVRARSNNDLENITRQQVLSAARPLIVLTPTAIHWTSVAHDVLAGNRSILVSADTVFDTNGWCAGDAWAHALDTIRRMILPESLVPAPAPYEFRKQGHFWVVRFNGKITHVKDAVGLAYIAELLAAPRRKFFAPDLVEGTTGETIAKQVGSAGEQADRQALDELKTKYIELQEGLEEAERNNDPASQSRLQSELDKLTEYLMQVKGFGGRTRQASDDADRIRRSVTQAIGRVVSWLRDDLPEAAQHLDNAIKTGLFVSYEPEEELHWEL